MSKDGSKESQIKLLILMAYEHELKIVYSDFVTVLEVTVYSDLVTVLKVTSTFFFSFFNPIPSGLFGAPRF